jgi:hypothetical protein
MGSIDADLSGREHENFCSFFQGENDSWLLPSVPEAEVHCVDAIGS